MDRNPKNPMISVNEIPSLSARRAWIEIVSNLNMLCSAVVALRKESVDRNLYYGDDLAFSDGRSPQGERG